MKYKHLPDQTVWPVPNEELAELAWRLSHNHPIVTREKSDLILAASVISAYAALFEKTQKRRNEIIKAVRP